MAWVPPKKCWWCREKYFGESGGGGEVGEWVGWGWREIPYFLKFPKNYGIEYTFHFDLELTFNSMNVFCSLLIHSKRGSCYLNDSVCLKVSLVFLFSFGAVLPLRHKISQHVLTFKTRQTWKVKRDLRHEEELFSKNALCVVVFNVFRFALFFRKWDYFQECDLQFRLYILQILQNYLQSWFWSSKQQIWRELCLK